MLEKNYTVTAARGHPYVTVALPVFWETNSLFFWRFLNNITRNAYVMKKDVRYRPRLRIIPGILKLWMDKKNKHVTANMFVYLSSQLDWHIDCIVFSNYNRSITLAPSFWYNSTSYFPRLRLRRIFLTWTLVIPLMVSFIMVYLC